MKLEPFFSKIGKRISTRMRKTIVFVTRIAVSVVLVAAIILSVWLSLSVARTSPRMAVIASSAAVSCFSFILALVSLPLLKKIVRYDEREMQEQIREQEEEIAKLKKDKEGLEEKEVDFQKRITLLENLTFNMETYRDVFKICFRDYKQDATIKKHENINEDDDESTLSRMLGRQGKSYDEVLFITDCEISYQRGIDLQKVKIAKINNSTVVVSGIKGEYMTMPRFDYKDFFSEIRHVKLDKNGTIKRINVEDDEYYTWTLNKKQNEYKAQFEDSFLRGKDNDDNEELIKRAEDFIRIILQPIYPHVEFDNDTLPNDSRPLLKFLYEEKGLYKAMLEKQQEAAIQHKEQKKIGLLHTEGQE